MRVLVISDLHANDLALQAVLKDAGAVDATWCLGDLVGYGPDPNPVVERLRGLPKLTCIMGNHDSALVRSKELEIFNGDARTSLNWTQNALTPDNLAFMESLPRQTRREGPTTLVHGSPRDPTWEYVLSAVTARQNFGSLETPYCFVGHSHIQSLFKWDKKNDRVESGQTRVGETVILSPPVIVNPGSVGQPRDRDSRAAYAIFDSDKHTWEPRRATYDITEVQKRIHDAGLPARHASRLVHGT